MPRVARVDFFRVIVDGCLGNSFGGFLPVADGGFGGYAEAGAEIVGKLFDGDFDDASGEHYGETVGFHARDFRVVDGFTIGGDERDDAGGVGGERFGPRHCGGQQGEGCKE